MKPMYSMEVYNHLREDPPDPRNRFGLIGLLLLGLSAVLFVVLLHTLIP